MPPAAPAQSATHTVGSGRISAEKLKPWVEVAQAIVTILAIIIGGIWTYRLFILQREMHAHANVDVTVSRVAITDKVALYQVIVKTENTGHELISLKHATVWLQQVLPIDGCEADQPCVTDALNAAYGNMHRVEDKFGWPVLQQRDAAWTPPHRIEPGESDVSDFEFAVPAYVQVLRIYAFLPNEDAPGTGWHVGKILDTRKADPVSAPVSKEKAP